MRRIIYKDTYKGSGNTDIVFETDCKLSLDKLKTIKSEIKKDCDIGTGFYRFEEAMASKGYSVYEKGRWDDGYPLDHNMEVLI